MRHTSFAAGMIALGVVLGTQTGAAAQSRPNLRPAQKSLKPSPIQLRPSSSGSPTPNLASDGMLAPFNPSTGQSGGAGIGSAFATLGGNRAPAPVAQPFGTFGGPYPYSGPSPYGGAYPYGAAYPYGGPYPYGGAYPYGGVTPYPGMSPFGSAYPYNNAYGYPGLYPGVAPYGGYPGYPGNGLLPYGQSPYAPLMPYGPAPLNGINPFGTPAPLGTTNSLGGLTQPGSPPIVGY